KRFIYALVFLLTVGVWLAACGGGGTSSTSTPASGPANDGSSSTGAGETSSPITLKLADTFPTTHGMNRVTNEVFIKKLEESGKVKIEYYPAGQMGKAEDM